MPRKVIHRGANETPCAALVATPSARILTTVDVDFDLPTSNRDGRMFSSSDSQRHNALHSAVLQKDKVTFKDICLNSIYYCHLCSDQDEGGNYPAHYVAAEGLCEFLEILFNSPYKNTLYAKNKDSNTPLHVAAYYGRANAVETLCSYKADVNERGKFGWAGVHYAAWEGHGEVLSLLLEQGANVNVCDEDGNTPLHIAAGSPRANAPDCINRLKKSEADTKSKNKRGLTPLAIASWYCHWGAISSLRKH
jgi:ankyrin repeat protein